MKKSTFLAFLDLKKAYDSVTIFNILTKLYNLEIRDNYLNFLTNLYISSKARASLRGNLSDEFPINRGVRQGCPLSPILFNLFINDIVNNCERYGVPLDGYKCCGGLFADYVVLIAPSSSALRNMLVQVNSWANINEMKFGINKCAIMIIRPKNFDSNGSPDPTFYIDNHPLPKTSCYTYLGIPFPNTLNLKPIISILNDKLTRSMNSHYILLSNKHIPLHIKKYILIYFVLALVNYFAPLLGSNKSNTSKKPNYY